jgi:hypothetical protein
MSKTPVSGLPPGSVDVAEARGEVGLGRASAANDRSAVEADTSVSPERRNRKEELVPANGGFGGQVHDLGIFLK